MNEDNARRTEVALRHYGPKRPLPELIEAVNRFYHASEANDYDRKHVEIFRQLPLEWAQLIDTALAHLNERPVRILDFGCGTGFEAQQLLHTIPNDRIVALTCYDPSREMLAQCVEKISPIFGQASFVDSLDDLASLSDGYDLVATNSLLHHLPDIGKVVQRFREMTSADAVWIAGHEPSRRFYLNDACIEAFNTFKRQRRWRRFLSPRNYLNRISAALGIRSSPASYAAKRAFETGLFERQPPEFVISRMVDFHVAHTSEEVAAGKGLDFEDLSNELREMWKPLTVRTYSYMGPFYEGRLSRRWQRTCAELARQYPNDGCNFGMVWQRA